MSTAERHLQAGRRPSLAEHLDPGELSALTVGGFFLRAAERDPDAPFLVTREGRLAYGEARALAERAAREFAAAGIGKGDRVAFLIGNGVEFVVRWLGLALLGGVLVAVDPRYREREIRRLLDHAEPRALVLDGANEQGVLGREWARRDTAVLDVNDPHEASAEPVTAAAVSADDPVSIIYSSGTTGAPKGVIQTHANYVLTGEAYPSWLRLRPASRLYACLPLCHINAQAYSVMGAIGMGGSVALVPRFSVTRFWSDVTGLGVDAFNFIGAMITLLVKQPPSLADRSHEVRVAYGVPSLPTPLRDAFEQRFGITVISGYGMSETTFGMIEDPAGERRALSVGTVRSHPGRPIVNEARIVDGDGRDLPPGEVGELWLRNPVTMSGYLKDPKRTDAVFTDGWLRTGDHLRRDTDDFFYFVDRADDVIRHKGENVASAEVETILDSHPAVLESAVLGVASELTDKEIVAFVQLREGEAATEEALRGWCRESLAPFKVPETFVFVEALPKTATNKVRKNELRVLLDRPRAGETR